MSFCSLVYNALALSEDDETVYLTVSRYDLN